MAAERQWERESAVVGEGEVGGLLGVVEGGLGEGRGAEDGGRRAVSYTHLTLPTN